MKLIKEILTLLQNDEFIKKTLVRLLGYKYRIVILKSKGAEMYDLSSNFFEDTPQGNQRLEDFIVEFKSNSSLVPYEIKSFRSRNNYKNIVGQKPNKAETFKALREQK